MLTQTGSCPVCGELNSHSSIDCIECHARLPWADAAEAAHQQAAKAAEEARQAQMLKAQAALGANRIMPNAAPHAGAAPGGMAPAGPPQIYVPGSMPPARHAPPANGVDSRLALGFIGSVMLAAGVFLPMVTVPFLGSINYFARGSSDGGLILVLAVASLALTAKAQFKTLALTGGVALVKLIYFYVQFKQIMSALTDLGARDNPFMRGIADTVSNSVHFSIGLPVMLIGAGLLVVSAVLDLRES